MITYHFEYWYRHGNFEKEFDQVSITAKSEEEAIVEVNKIRRFIFSIKLKRTDERKS